MASGSVLKVNSFQELDQNWQSNLDFLLDALSQYQLKPERERNLTTLIIARWHEEKMKSFVLVVKSNHLETVGVNESQFIWLNALETLYLVDKSRMVLTRRLTDEIISLEECISNLMLSGFSLGHYLVYSNLKTLGAVVQLHNPKYLQMDEVSSQKEEDASDTVTGLPSASNSTSPDGPTHNQDQSIIRPIFDVWLPKQGSKWSKKKHPAPDFSLLLIEGTSESTQQDVFQQLLSFHSIKSNFPNRSFKVASVSLGNVDYFEIDFPSHNLISKKFKKIP